MLASSEVCKPYSFVRDNPRLKLVASPEHHNFDVAQVPAWAWVLAITNLLGWNGKAVFSWLARVFESNAAREQKIQDEVAKRKAADDSKAWELADQRRLDDKETITVLRSQVDQLIKSQAELQRALGQTQQTVDENSSKLHQVEKKADIVQALTNPEVMSRIQQQASEEPPR